MQLFGGKKSGKHTDSSKNNSGRTPERYDDYDYYAESKQSAHSAQPIRLRAERSRKRRAKQER